MRHFHGGFRSDLVVVGKDASDVVLPDLYSNEQHLYVIKVEVVSC